MPILIDHLDTQIYQPHLQNLLYPIKMHALIALQLQSEY